jgi:hypothetical protein
MIHSHAKCDFEPCGRVAFPDDEGDVLDDAYLSELGWVSLKWSEGDEEERVDETRDFCSFACPGGPLLRPRRRFPHGARARMAKLTWAGGKDGRFVTYGLDGEMARNYIKHGLYVKDSELRLPPPKGFWYRVRRVVRGD